MRCAIVFSIICSYVSILQKSKINEQDLRMAKITLQNTANATLGNKRRIVSSLLFLCCFA